MKLIRSAILASMGVFEIHYGVNVDQWNGEPELNDTVNNRIEIFKIGSNRGAIIESNKPVRMV